MLRPYDVGDLPELDRWHREQVGSPLDVAALPPVGIIEPGVAVGFLFLTDARVGMLDGFMVNPSAPLRARRDALTGILERLMAVARARGARRLFGFTQQHGIGALGERAGFRKDDGYSVLVREV